MLPRTSPDSVHVDPAGIADFLAENEAQGRRLQSVMVLRHGQVIAERVTPPWRSDLPRLVYSLSKTFTSSAVALAIEAGAFGLDDLVVDLFPDLVDDRVGPKMRTLRVRHLLAMASGHTQDMLLLPGPRRGELDEQDLAEFLRTEPEGTPGETFCYNQMCSWTLARAVRRHLGVDIHDLLQERVLGPLGIEGTVWTQDSEGCSFGWSGLHVTTEHLARYYQLLLDDGVHEGRRLLPEGWVALASRKHVETAADAWPDWAIGYGLHLWPSRHGFRGDGAYGQLGLMLPEQDMVVVTTCETADMPDMIEGVWNHVLPAVDRPGTPDGQQRLDEALAAMALPPVEGDAGEGWSGTLDDGDAFSLVPDGQGWQATWAMGASTPKTFAVGHCTWAETLLREGDRTLPVAASAGRDTSGTTVTVVFPSTPHQVALRLPAEGDAGEWEWSFAPLSAATPWHLAQPGA